MRDRAETKETRGSSLPGPVSQLDGHSDVMREGLESAWVFTFWEFLEGLIDAGSLPVLRENALRVRAVIPGSVMYFNEVDLPRGVMINVSDPPAASSPPVCERYWRLRDQHPVIAEFERAPATLRPLAISDLVGECSFRESGLYTRLYRELGMADQLLIPVPHPVATVTLCVGRGAWGFTDAEHVAARVIQRTLSSAYTQLRRRDVAHVVQQVASDLLEGSGATLCVVDEFDQIRGPAGEPVDLDRAVADAISSATQVVRRDGDGAIQHLDCGPVLVTLNLSDTSGVPVTVRILRSDDGHRWPVIVKRPAETLGVEQLVARGLTSRQADVTALLLQGQSAGEVALALGISPRTVEKHTAAVCRTLGARTRTEALLKLATEAGPFGV